MPEEPDATAESLLARRLLLLLRALGAQAEAHDQVEAVVVDLRHGLWRGGLQEMLPELIRRARVRRGGGVQVHVEIVRDLEQAATLIDQLGRRLLAGETILALGDPIDADLIEHHARIYAMLPTH